MEEHTETQLQKPVTIRDVAKRAKTSIATVSYVLNDRDRYLRPELKERVLQAARELGYVKNALASSLKGNQRGILAVLVPQFGNSFFTRMCVSIEEVARQEGYIVTLCNSYENPAQERIILERLLAQRIDGCILSTALSEANNIALLHQYKVPFVILDRSLPTSFLPYDFVGHDNYQTGYLATKKLLDAGHKRIAFSGWDSPIPSVRERVDGYKAAMREYGLPVSDEFIFLDEITQTAGENMAQKLLAAKVTGVVLGQHDTAKGTLIYFQNKGVKWPQDISIVLIGTPEWIDMLNPSLTCIKRPEQQMGRLAASLLLEKIRGKSQNAIRQIFSCEVVVRCSVKKIN